VKARTVLLGGLMTLALLFLGPRSAPPGTDDRVALNDPTLAEPCSAAPVASIPPPAPVHPAVTATTLATEDRAVFEGHVASAVDGQGVVGAELTFALGSAAASVRVDASGAFRFEPPVRGLWTLAAATAPSFLPFAPEWATSPVLLDARPGARVSGIEVVLWPAVKYRGEVLDSADQPVVGAEVRLLSAAAGAAALFPLQERYVTESDGGFVFVAPDGVRLEARAEGFEPGHAEIDLAARASRRVTIRLRSGAIPPAGETIVGSVLQLASGAPIAGALVAATPRGADAPVRQALTDATGAFTMHDLSPGSYRLDASAGGLAPVRRWSIRAGARDVVLRLAPGGAITGRVRDRRTGAPVAPFVVAVYMPDGPLEPLRSQAVIDAEGRFAVAGVPPGPTLVVVSSPGHAPSPGIPVVVSESGAPPYVNVDLGVGGAVEGVVLDLVSGEPIKGAEVEADGLRVNSAGVLPIRQRATSGADGRFTLAGVPEGGASLLVRAAGHHARIVRGLEVRGAEITRSVVKLSPGSPDDEPDGDGAHFAAFDPPGVRNQLR
jgi:hypothetical protein